MLHHIQSDYYLPSHGGSCPMHFHVQRFPSKRLHSHDIFFRLDISFRIIIQSSSFQNMFASETVIWLRALTSFGLKYLVCSSFLISPLNFLICFLIVWTFSSIGLIGSICSFFKYWSSWIVLFLSSKVSKSGWLIPKTYLLAVVLRFSSPNKSASSYKSSLNCSSF